MDTSPKSNVTTLAAALQMDARYVSYLAWLARLQTGTIKRKTGHVSPDDKYAAKRPKTYLCWWFFNSQIPLNFIGEKNRGNHGNENKKAAESACSKVRASSTF